MITLRGGDLHDRGVTPAQVALAWVYAQQEQLGVHPAPISGTERVKWLEQNAVALDVTLTAGELSSSTRWSAGPLALTPDSWRSELGSFPRDFALGSSDSGSIHTEQLIEIRRNPK
jgi:hypothetical protein